MTELVARIDDRVGGTEGEAVTSHFSVLNVRPLDVANSPTYLINILRVERLRRCPVDACASCEYIAV